jgi:hypothetical protein
MRQCGRVIVDLLPYIYDVRRIARLMGEDGTVDMVQADPNIPTAMQQVQDLTGKVRKVINPTVGRYDVMVVSGPSYTTKRQEGAEWMTQALQGNPQLLQVMGDLYFRALDVPYADEIAKRMKAMLPPQVLQSEEEGNQGIPPQVAAQMQQMGAALQDAQQQLQAAAAEVGKAQMAAQSKQGDLAIKQQELQIKAQELQLKASELALKERELSLKEAELQADTAIEVAKLQADTDIRAMQAQQPAEAEEAEDEEPERDEPMGQIALGMQLAQAIAGLQQQIGALAQQVAGVKTVAIQPIKDAQGRVIGGRLQRADGTVDTVGVQ